MAVSPTASSTFEAAGAGFRVAPGGSKTMLGRSCGLFGTEFRGDQGRLMRGERVASQSEAIRAI